MKYNYQDKCLQLNNVCVCNVTNFVVLAYLRFWRCPQI